MKLYPSLIGAVNVPEKLIYDSDDDVSFSKIEYITLFSLFRTGNLSVPISCPHIPPKRYATSPLANCSEVFPLISVRVPLLEPTASPL